MDILPKSTTICKQKFLTLKIITKEQQSPLINLSIQRIFTTEGQLAHEALRNLFTLAPAKCQTKLKALIKQYIILAQLGTLIFYYSLSHLLQKIRTQQNPYQISH